jgi:hypothetical protein
MVTDFVSEMWRVSDHLYYLALLMSFACAYALNHVTGSTSRGINSFFIFVLVSLAAVVFMKFTGFSLTGNRDMDAVYAMAAAMSACVVALTVLFMFYSKLSRR